jgi:nucleoside-specific outer membrane channel protein Tsx
VGAHAADWSTANVQLLHGSGFELGKDSRSIMTFEYASRWKYGDTFFFVDATEPAAKGTSLYAEFAPRFSLSALSGKKLSFGIVKDVLIATTQEVGDGVRATLIGPGLALDLPKFAFADLNFYYRKSSRDAVAVQSDGGFQVTLDWKLPFTLGSQQMSFEGFADYAWGERGGTSPKADNVIAAPRLLIDAGHWVGAPGKVQFGIEYQIWHNKFGIRGVDEEVPQVMVKWMF